MIYTDKQVEQRREAVKRYTAEKVDRVNCLLPIGTKYRIKDVAPDESINAFIKAAVLDRLETLEKYNKKN